MPVISFYTQKGGTGKSTVCCETAYILSQRKKARVLVIDLDAQCNTTKHLCGYIPEKGIYDLIIDEAEEQEFHECLTPGKNFWGKLVVLGSSKRLDTAVPILQNRMNRDYVLKSIIDKLKGYFEYILIDYPPQLNLLTTNGLAASDGYILIQQPEEWSVDGAKTITDLADKVRKNLNPKLKCFGVLVNLVKKDNSLYVKTMIKDIEEEWQGKVFNSKIMDTVVVGEAKKLKKPVVLYSPAHKVTSQLIGFVKELTEKIGKSDVK